MAPRAAGLDAIARAEASPARAREALLAVFARPSPELLRDAYLALRAWAWKALDQRRRGPELREWGDVLGAAASLMARHGQPALAERLAALRELVGESIAAGEALAARDAARRRHVAAVLDFLAGDGGWAGRGAIGARTPLGEADLTRVLNLMAAAGLVERGMPGGEAAFRLSRTGLEVQCARPEGPPVATTAPQPAPEGQPP